MFLCFCPIMIYHDDFLVIYLLVLSNIKSLFELGPIIIAACCCALRHKPGCIKDIDGQSKSLIFKSQQFY